LWKKQIAEDESHEDSCQPAFTGASIFSGKH
jgi:hypothetical protein